ncbi:unnamed protein product [Toxocara canis]|uniref:AcidPPc domain-containing protein n=1 Tax=Toxocara canis TaxID=6265 RepID=A0A183V4D9_TOXCA|nr:unnamed protein product [Toxocara canis]
MLVGCVTGLVRCLEMKQRLYPAIHEGFYVYFVTFLTGFRNRNRSVWYLLRLSMLVGCVTGLVRCLEMKQRLYPAIHEGFYVYFVTFLTGVVLALQPGERFSKIAAQPSEATATCSGKEGLENNEVSKQITTNGVDKTFADSCEIVGILSSSMAIISEGAEKCPKDK